MDFEMYGMILDLINETMEKIKGMDTPPFTCFVCMLLEEFCKAKEEDVVRIAEFINTAVKQVNEEEGRY